MLQDVVRALDCQDPPMLAGCGMARASLLLTSAQMPWELTKQEGREKREEASRAKFIDIFFPTGLLVYL